jgi:hypothetical protein
MYLGGVGKSLESTLFKSKISASYTFTFSTSLYLVTLLSSIDKIKFKALFLT